MMPLSAEQPDASPPSATTQEHPVHQEHPVQRVADAMELIVQGGELLLDVTTVVCKKTAAMLDGL